ncbi:MAG: cytochrome c biogenesis protein ResB [Candidatus Planktophila sp.]
MTKNQVEIPEIGARGLLRFAWRQLTSMRTALILLMMLGIAAIPGSLLPQRNQNPMAVRAYFADQSTLAEWIDRFGGFDVYASSWFSAIYILLFISLIGCVLPRTFEHYRAMRALPPATPKNLEKLEAHHEFAGEGGELQRAEKWLRKRRFRLRIQEGSISAEKGYLRESGNLLFHLSLILILIGVSVGSLFGMRGDAIITTGERFINLATSYDSVTFGKVTNETSLNTFSITLNKFVGKYDPVTNIPLDYSAYVTTIDDQGKESNRVIKVNSPLTFGTTRVYLQANGYSPFVTIKDEYGNVTFQGAVPFLPQDSNLRSIGAIKVPESSPQIGFVSSFVPTYQRDPQLGAVSVYPELLEPKLLFSIWEGDLGLDTGIPQSIYKIDTTDMTRIALSSLAPGESYSFNGGSITFEKVEPWINLQIVRDPGKSYSFIGGILALLGLLASLFGRRRRIWVKVSEVGEVQVAGLAKTNSAALEIEIAHFVSAIKGEK